MRQLAAASCQRTIGLIAILWRCTRTSVGPNGARGRKRGWRGAPRARASTRGVECGIRHAMYPAWAPPYTFDLVPSTGHWPSLGEKSLLAVTPRQQQSYSICRKEGDGGRRTVREKKAAKDSDSLVTVLSSRSVSVLL
jgi:hypothetical protein